MICFGIIRVRVLFLHFQYVQTANGTIMAVPSQPPIISHLVHQPSITSQPPPSNSIQSSIPPPNILGQPPTGVPPPVLHQQVQVAHLQPQILQHQNQQVGNFVTINGMGRENREMSGENCQVTFIYYIEWV